LRSAASRTLIAVNVFVIDARGKTVEDVIGMWRSRLAFPYPRSRTTAPFRLAPTPQPGESARFHAAKTGSTLEATDAVDDDPQAAVRTIGTAMKKTDEATARACTFFLD
jgi:hypothetical protein